MPSLTETDLLRLVHFGSWSLLWIVLFPLLGAVISGLFGRFTQKWFVSAVAVGSVGASFLLSVVAFLAISFPEVESLKRPVFEWFSLAIQDRDFGIEHTAEVNVAFRLDELSGVMALVVTGIGLLIHIYSLGYMKKEKSYARFFSYLNLFTASMLILILADNMPLMFVGWEGVGLCSYLLIGFWWENPAYASAGRKAFVVNRIGDFGVLIGMFLLVQATGSFEFDDINSAARSLALKDFTLGGLIPSGEVTLVTAACLFLFLGCAGKSAQIPLYVWLPDAMAGPTPVSALIHAATMVTAGVYLCCRLSEVFLQSPFALSVIAIIGALTALLAASIALVQNDLKKILAYSTVSQLGFMFAAVGCGAFAAAFFHVFTHAFFKACLFLGAGAVMHAVDAHGDADIRKLGGLKKHIPLVWITFLVSCLAIAGVPLFSGFFSKDEILAGAVRVALSEGGPDAISPVVGWIVFGCLTLAATMTAFYMFRLYFVTFHGEYRSASQAQAHGHDDHAHGHDDHGEHPYLAQPQKTPFAIGFPLVLLAIGATLGGYLSIGLLHFDPWGEWLSGAVASLEASEDLLTKGHTFAPIAGTLAMLIGLGLPFVLYLAQKRVPGPNPTHGIARVLYNKWYVDEFYRATVVRFAENSARFAGFLDKTLIDGVLAKLTALTVQAFGYLSTRIQNGLIYVYAAVMVVGVLAIGGWFLYPHAVIEVNPDGGVSRTTVDLKAAAGLGYVYQWNLDDDEEWEATGPQVDGHEFTRDDYLKTVVTIASHGHETEVTEFPYEIPPHLLGEGETWAETRGGARAPALELDDEGDVVLTRNDATVRYDDASVTEPTVDLEFGKVLSIGDADIRVERRALLSLVLIRAGEGQERDEEIIEVPVNGEPITLDHDFGGEWWVANPNSPEPLPEGLTEIVELGDGEVEVNCPTNAEPRESREGWQCVCSSGFVATREEVEADEGEEEAERGEIVGCGYPRPPAVSHRNGRLVFRYNDVATPRPSEGLTEDVDIGRTIAVGQSQLLVGTRVSVTLRVANAFGNEDEQTHEILLRPSAEETASASDRNRPHAALMVGGEER